MQTVSMVQTPRRAAIYCRVSSAGQEDNFSLETQRAGATKLAVERGYTVVGSFTDVHSGSELFERPQLTALRHAIRAGSVDIVIAHAIDRVSRNQTHLGFLLSELDHYEVQLELVTETLEDTPEGRLLQSVRGFVAEMERLKIIERTRRGSRARVDSGKPMGGGRAPYGLQWADAEKSKLIVDDEVLPILLRIFESVLAGQSLRSLAADLTRSGIPTPTGKNPRWEVSSVQSILSNPIYTGRAFAYRWKQERKRGRFKTSIKPEDEWVPLPDGVAPRIISEETSAAIKARLAHNKAMAPRNCVNPEAVLLRGGFGRCGYCGRPLAVTRRQGGRYLYRCHPVAREREGCPSFGTSAVILDSAVWEKVELVLTNPGIISSELDRRSSADNLSDDLRAIDRRLKDVESRRGRLARAIAALDDEDASAPILLELKSLADTTKQLTAERQAIERRRDDEDADRAKLMTLLDWCKVVSERLASLDWTEKRMILEALGVTVRLYRADHDPRWEIIMAPPPMDDRESSVSLTSEGIPSLMEIPV